ncbi:phage tail protein [Telluribacter humicola]|uniref:phage tail protein n=1 Tax=Telluribacter humicola TaxID=1720261 RepID=UPI001A970C63|nr:tail fiber protein [Telluribacter humicola]
MSDQFLAEIRIFPFNFAPTGWAFCHGQLIPLSQNTALYALLGTIYGGDGKSTFALPNMIDSVPVQPGQGQGLTYRSQGETSGASTLTLLQSEIPVHTHNVRVMNEEANDNLPAPSTAITSSARGNVYSTAPPNTAFHPASLSATGSSLPHNNMMPYLTVNFCIALQGVFPPRA